MLNKFLSCTLSALLLAGVSLNAWSGQLVREFTGSRTADTAEFEVRAPWLIDWRVNSEYPDEMGLSISLINAGPETYAGRVVKTKYRGDGLRLMHEGGRYRFKVDSALADWTIRVEQLTEEEVEQYAPKSKSLLD